MSDQIELMIRKLLKRQPTMEDYKIVNDLIRDLPEEILRSPAAVAEIVLRMESIRRFEASLKQATWDAQQRIHADLPMRVDQAALSALNKLRDQMPIDAKDRVARLAKWIFAWSAFVLIVGVLSGVIVAQNRHRHDLVERQTAVDAAFNVCLNAAEGVSVKALDRRTGKTRYDPEIYRIHARACALEFADRYPNA